MAGLNRYFGEGCPFTVACRMVSGKELPIEIRLHAQTQGRSEVAFLLGYAFGLVCKRTDFQYHMIEVKQIAENKITYGDSSVFVDAFRDAAYR